VVKERSPLLEDCLQLIVDRLAERLSRSVIVDDPALRPLAVSAQLGRVDQARIDAVLQRRTSDRIRALISRHGVPKASDPVRIPANAQLGTLARLVIPLVGEGYHLGYLWLIDDPALTPPQVGEALAYAVEAGRLLSARVMQESQEANTARRLVDDLLRPDRRVRERAAERIRDLDLVEGTPPYAVGVVCAVHRLPDATGIRGSPADLRRLASDVRRRAGTRAAACGTPRAGQLVLVTTAARQEFVFRTLRSAASGYALGTRSGVDSLELVREAREDARYAAEVAGAVPPFQGAADWASLGPYAAFQCVERNRNGLERICPGVSALWARGHEMHESTVRCYLTSGANAQKTAAALQIHRTTLYWRLAAVERLLGIDLSDGYDRLRLHMALMLADLIPDLPHPPAVGPVRKAAQQPGAGGARRL
jgi:hypothetical protein